MSLIKKLLFFLIISFYFSPSFSFFDEGKNNFLVISDIHLDANAKHTMNINPEKFDAENDLDLPSFEKFMSVISESIKNGKMDKPNFILILGDIVGHQRSTVQQVIENEKLVFSKLKDHFPYFPIFYVFGNNDSLAINYGPFFTKNLIETLRSPFDVAKFSGWKNGFLSNGLIFQGRKINFPHILHQEIEQGYYSAYLAPKFRFIALNSVLFSVKRQQVSEQTALTQLEWLENELKQAKLRQESILLAMHIPPGQNVYDNSSFWFPKEQTHFLKMIKEYQTNIIGLLVSHTHFDEFKIINRSTGDKLGVYFTSALSTSHGNAPAVKVFYYAKNQQQWQLTNFEVFHFNNDDSSKILFGKLYDYASYYGYEGCKGLALCLKNMTPEKMEKYFSAGNKNFSSNMKFPDATSITL